MDLSVIIVSWNVKEKLRANLQALLVSQTKYQFEVLVVDNNSADGSAAMVEKEFPSVRLVANQDNLGFAKANNQALSQIQGRHVLLLNPDMLVSAGALENMIQWADNNPQAVITGFKLTDETGNIVPQVRRFPKLFDQLMIVFKLPHLFPGILNRYLVKRFDYDQAAAVDSVRGACFFINGSSWRKTMDIKPFLDERYFIWFEEVDLCRQVVEKGGEVWYSPVATVIDYVGASFKQVGRSQKQNYFADSMIKYFAKWEPRWQSKVLRAAWRLWGVKISK